MNRKTHAYHTLIKHLILGMFLIPLAIFAFYTLGTQFGPAQIDGKGGYERSFQHPFICQSRVLTEGVSEYYCNGAEFASSLLRDFVFWGPLFFLFYWLPRYLAFSALFLIGAYIYKKQFLQKSDHKCSPCRITGD
ncbi:hypothetical protein COV82_00035 [Candidatus Peregrinibacteria bacterium CG11_big_fil_rev_8_21_14_0_20_46_8]|nr:MAG: hypothetical protein COV82_00035 [Candidatus Peregrinibacteria bacterium CG11_big_fil_rev_8_21_14_0_20_46_8]